MSVGRGIWASEHTNKEGASLGDQILLVNIHGEPVTDLVHSSHRTSLDLVEFLFGRLKSALEVELSLDTLSGEEHGDEAEGE